MNIRNRMFAIIIVFSIIPVILVSYVINYTYNKNTEQTLLDNLASSVDIYESNINSFFRHKKTELHILGNIKQVRQYIHNKNVNENYIDNSEYNDIKEFLFSCVNSGEYILNIDIIDKNDIVVISNDTMRENKLSEFSCIDDIKNIDEEGVIYSNVVLDPINNMTYFSTAIPIYSDGFYIGCIVMDTNLEYIKVMAEESEFYNTGYVSVVDGNNFSVASKGPYVGEYISEVETDNENTFSREWKNAINKGNSEGFFKYKINGTEKIAFFNNINGTEWNVLGSVDVDEVFLPLNNTGTIVIFFVFIMLIFDIAAFYMYTKSITIPINKMIDATEEINKGDYSIRVDYTEDDEFGKISKVFNDLMDNIQYNTNKLKNLNNDFSILTSNIPGGMIRCSVDEVCEFDFVSESFLKLMRCSRDDLEYVYNGSYIQIIHEDDVDYILDIIKNIKEDGDVIEVEYRVRRPDNSIIWVKDKSRVVSDAEGKPWMYIILIDVTKDKEHENAFKKREERFSKLVNWSENIIFEWDSAKGTVAISDIIRHKLGYNPLKLSADGKSIKISNIFPDDKEKFYSIFEKIKNGETGIEEEIRLKKIPENIYVWFKIKAGVIRADDDKVYKIIGVMYDIDNIKNHENIIKGRRDLFTGFYTKDGMELVVNDSISKDDENFKKALIIFDIRGFNALKEKMGIKFAETVISDIAGKLSHTFDRSDVISRISESRFAVFTKSAISKSMVIMKTNETMDILKSEYRNNDVICSIQSCAGISRYPKDGENFGILYQKAETALISAIEKGNGKYTIYEEIERQMD